MSFTGSVGFSSWRFWVPYGLLVAVASCCRCRTFQHEKGAIGWCRGAGSFSLGLCFHTGQGFSLRHWIFSLDYRDVVPVGSLRLPLVRMDSAWPSFVLFRLGDGASSANFVVTSHALKKSETVKQHPPHTQQHSHPPPPRRLSQARPLFLVRHLLRDGHQRAALGCFSAADRATTACCLAA